jgi:hypothetical protein
MELQPSYWSESTRQFITLSNVGWPPILPADLQQIGWPIHTWTLSITNNLMYALVDNASQQGLDFVNLGAFGSYFNISQALTNLDAQGLTNLWGPSNIWAVGNATDAPYSRMPLGDLIQIMAGMEAELLFSNSLLGLQPSLVGQTFGAPFSPSVIFFENCSWHTGNPLVHFTVEDLTSSEFNQEVLAYPIDYPFDLNEISESICTLGGMNPNANSGAIASHIFSLSNGAFQIGFSGVADLPYAIWASTNILDWSQIGTAAQPSPGIFQFNDSSAALYPARFYQVREP